MQKTIVRLLNEIKIISDNGCKFEYLKLIFKGVYKYSKFIHLKNNTKILIFKILTESLVDKEYLIEFVNIYPVVNLYPFDDQKTKLILFITNQI